MSLRTFLRSLLVPEEHAIDKMALWGTGQDIGDPVHAGVLVSQESALRLAVVWACVRLISGTLAAMPVDIVRKAGPVRQPVDRPPRWVEFPNPEATWFEFCERVHESMEMDGNAFILVTGRDFQGFPSEIWTLHPRSVEVKREERRIVYLWGADKVRLSRYDPVSNLGDVLHIRATTAGGLRGLSPIEHARQAIGLGLVTEKTGARFFGEGMLSNIGLELPADSPGSSREHIALMRAELKQQHSGSDRSFRPFFATGGATWKQLTISPEDAQFLQTRAFQVEDIASRIYGIPPHMVGLTEKQTSWGTGIEAQASGFLRFHMMPRITRFEQAMSGLLPRGQFFHMNQRQLLRADSKTEAEVLTMLEQWGVMNRNEIRALYDQPPVPGGDRYILPLNYQILGPDGNAAPSPNGRVPANVGGNGGQAP